MTRTHEDNGPGAGEFGLVALTANSHAQMERFRSSHETSVLTILITDLEGSTQLQSSAGNVRAAELVRTFRKVFRESLRGIDGQEVETAGDSFLAVFAAPSEGVKFALRMQAAMRQVRQKDPQLPQARTGIHQGQVVVERHADGPKAMDIYGLQVSTAARIADLARGSQILCSRAVFDDARAILRAADLQGVGPVTWRNHGPYQFKGVQDTHEVCEVGEEGLAPLEAPAAGAKGWPAGHALEELGWRPAVGVVVPGTNWVLEERLGGQTPDRQGRRAYEGEFGEVWKAYNPSDKSRQVFKFCFKRDRVPALKRESRLLKRLRKYRHPNLVEVYDLTEGDRPPFYLEMEYVEGPSLEEWLSARPGLKDRLEIVAQVADVLDTVHAAGIYHRDIKPSNILLTHREDGALQAKLTDFGLGAAEDTELLKSIYASRAEGVAGTWDYIAPELRKGRAASPQSDLYSLGVTLYQIVVGDLRRALGDWESHVESEVLREDIRRCIATDPHLRWEHAADLARALRSHDERMERLRLEREREQRRRRAKRIRRIAAVAAVLVLAALAGLIYWWRLPGTLELDVRPAGARIEIAGRVLTAAGWPIRLRLRAGYYETRITADDHFPDTRVVVVERGKSKQLLLALRHHQAVLEAECEPVGSEIEINGVAYGSRIRNLPLDTGRYRLLAWSNNHLESERTIQLARDEHVKERFWLDYGLHWTYTSPAVQGAAYFVADVDGDGIPDFAQNELNYIVIHSTRTGKALWRLAAPSSGSRAFMEMDLGGDVGRVLAAAKEEPSLDGQPGGLDVFVIRTAGPPQLLWRWSGPRLDHKQPAGGPMRAVGDRSGDGVAELAVGSRNGRIYILDGKTGKKISEISVWDGVLDDPPFFELLAGQDDALVYVVRLGNPPGRAGRRFTAGCVRLSNGETIWRKDLGRADGAILRDLDGDDAAELLLWNDSGWRVTDCRSGQVRWRGAPPEGRRMAACPLMTDLDGDKTLEFLLAPGEGGEKMLAMRSSDGRVMWEGPSRARPQQPLTRDGLLWRAPRGEVLVAMEDALAAIDPRTGEVLWQVAGAPEGVLIGEWDKGGQENIFVTMQGRGLMCLDAAGKCRWTLRLNLDVRPYAIVPDTDGDGLPEILIHRHAALFGLVRGPRILWSQAATAPLQATPIVADGAGGGKAAVIQSGPWSGGEHLRCLDARSGAIRWGTRCWFAPNRAQAVADWDGDGQADMVGIGQMPGTGKSYLLAFRLADGEVIASTALENAGAIYSTPVVADLNGDGVADFATHRWDGQDIIAIDGKTGGLMWRQPTGGPNMGGVGAADLDGDGRPDVVAPSMDGHLYALRGEDGRQVWPPAAIGRGGSRSPPLLADVSGDGVPDVLVVTQSGVMWVIDGRTGQTIWEATAAGATEGFGRPAVVKIGQRTLIVAPLGGAGAVAFDFANRIKLWQSPQGHAVLAGPVIADLDRDGLREVIVGTADGQVLVLDLATGKLLWRAAVGPQLIEADPAVHDVDGDGILDIVIADHGFRLTAVSGRGTIAARSRPQARAGQKP